MSSTFPLHAVAAGVFAAPYCTARPGPRHALCNQLFVNIVSSDSPAGLNCAHI